MGLFSKKTYLGVDIGTSSIKIVELENKDGRPFLNTYGSIQLDSDIIKTEDSGKQKEISEALKLIVKESGARSRKAISSLPGFSVFTTVIDMPKMSPKELASAIKWEARKYVPLSIEDMVLDWRILGERSKKMPNIGAGEKEVTNLRILLVATPRHIVKKYIDIFKKAKLNLLSLETESFALTRSLVGDDKSSILIIDIGSSSTDITIVNKGFPVLNLNVDKGGKLISKAIASSLDVDISRAEQFKKDFGISEEDGGQIPNTIRPIIDDIIKEIERSLNLYYNQEGRSIDKIVLTGGDAKMPKLAGYLGRRLNIKVLIGNPWARVEYVEEIGNTVKKVGPDYAVAIGLAMREIVK